MIIILMITLMQTIEVEINISSSEGTFNLVCPSRIPILILYISTYIHLTRI